jgi:hypothetical protein
MPPYIPLFFSFFACHINKKNSCVRRRRNILCTVSALLIRRVMRKHETNDYRRRLPCKKRRACSYHNPIRDGFHVNRSSFLLS